MTEEASPRMFTRETLQRAMAGFLVFVSIYLMGMLATDLVVGLGPWEGEITKTQLMYGFGWQAAGMAIAMYSAKRGWF